MDTVQLGVIAFLVAAQVAHIVIVVCLCRRTPQTSGSLCSEAQRDLVRTVDNSTQVLADQNDSLLELLKTAQSQLIAMSDGELARLRIENEGRALELNLRDARTRFLQTNAPKPQEPPSPDETEAVRTSSFTDNPDE